MYMGLMMLGRHVHTSTAEPLAPEPRNFEVEMAIEKLKNSQITRY
jgi:hypothetical protein